MRIRGFVALLAVGLLATACGGSSAKTGGAGPTTTKPATPQQLAADKALAQQAVLRLSDLPAGYKGTPHDESPDDTPPAVLKKFAACIHVPKSELEQLFSNAKNPNKPSVDAPDFQLDVSRLQQASFQNSVEVDRTTKEISEPLTLLAAPTAINCWKAFFAAAVSAGAPADGSIKSVTVAALPDPKVGDQATAFEARMQITASGITVPLYFDFYLARRGRAGVSLLGLGTGMQIDHALEVALLGKVVHRLAPAS